MWFFSLFGVSLYFSLLYCGCIEENCVQFVAGSSTQSGHQTTVLENISIALNLTCSVVANESTDISIAHNPTLIRILKNAHTQTCTHSVLIFTSHHD